MSELTTGKFISKEIKFVWEITNFSSINSEIHTGVPVNSPIFSTARVFKLASQWRLRLYPNGEKDKDFISIFLQNMNKLERKVTISIAVMSNLLKEVFKTPNSVVSIKPSQSSGWPKFEKKTSIADAKNHTLVNDTLIISCSILSENSPFDGYDIQKDMTAVSTYNQQLFETGNFSDVTFSIEDKQMRLHKNIVASLSPVFEAMFMYDMKESKDNLTTVTDIKYDTMKELFRYIYTRKVENLETIASDLLIAADKYAIEGLRMICEIYLCGSLNDDNALQHLHLAVMYNASCLKSKVVEFVADKLKMFVGKGEFKELSHDCKDEIFNALANKLST